MFPWRFHGLEGLFGNMMTVIWPCLLRRFLLWAASDDFTVIYEHVISWGGIQRDQYQFHGIESWCINQRGEFSGLLRRKTGGNVRRGRVITQGAWAWGVYKCTLTVQIFAFEVILCCLGGRLAIMMAFAVIARCEGWPTTGIGGIDLAFIGKIAGTRNWEKKGTRPQDTFELDRDRFFT